MASHRLVRISHARSARVVALGAAIVLSYAVHVQATGRQDVVALTGTQAPGTADDFSVFVHGNMAPVIDFRSGVLFEALLTGNPDHDHGIWVQTAAGQLLVARRGDVAPGTVTHFESFTNFPRWTNGRVAFRGLVGNPADPNRHAMWSGGPGMLQLVYREGQQAAGLAPGILYDSFNDPLLNANGWVAAAGHTTGLAGLQVIYAGLPGAWAPVAREGQIAPNTGGAQWRDFLTAVRLNNNNQLSFRGLLVRDPVLGVNSTNDHGIWVGDSTNLHLSWRTGQQAPGLPPGVVITDFLGTPDLNNNNLVALIAAWEDPVPGGMSGTAIWSGDYFNGIADLWARTGQPAAGTTAATTYAGFHSAIYSDAGVMAFRGHLDGPGVVHGVNETGIWLGATPPDVILAGRRGDPAPGTAAGVSFAFVGLPALSDDRQLAFDGVISGPGVTPGVNDTGIWLADTTGEVLLAVRAGDHVLVDPATGVTRQLQTVIFASDPPHIENPINIHGQVVYRGIFTDGSQAVITYTPTLRWRTPADGFWDVAGNWTLSVNPFHVHDVIVDHNAVNVDVEGPAIGSTVRTLAIGGSGAGARLTIRAPAILRALHGTVIHPNGILAGNGTLQGNLINHGTIAPGKSTGVLTIDGDYTQGPGAQVNIKLGGLLPGTDHDVLAIAGHADLDGDLAVSLDGGFISLPGTSYEVLTYGSHNGDLNIINQTGFAGLSFIKTFDPNSLILTADAIPGDANLDGMVTIADLSILASNWQQPADWLGGDFNGDAFVNIADLSLLAAHWQVGVPPPAQSMSFDEALAMFDVFNGVVIPEPAGVAGLMVAGLLATGRRRRLRS